MKNGKTVAFAILFVHDHKTAGDDLLESFKKEDDEKKSDIMMSEASDFLTYVIKEWSDEMKTEQSIGFEFLTSRNRRNRTSSALSRGIASNFSPQFSV